uniref:Putative secreted protein n=1 Tax=Ixodes ricinus TaxID=34613 RepID=A0A6B0TZ71_IXORI
MILASILDIGLILPWYLLSASTPGSDAQRSSACGHARKSGGLGAEKVHLPQWNWWSRLYLLVNTIHWDHNKAERNNITRTGQDICQ